MNDIDANKMAEDAITKMKNASLKGMEDIVKSLPDKVAKLILIKMIRASE